MASRCRRRQEYVQASTSIKGKRGKPWGQHNVQRPSGHGGNSTWGSRSLHLLRQCHWWFRARIGKARASFIQLKNIWSSKEISQRTELRLHRSTIKPILYYSWDKRRGGQPRTQWQKYKHSSTAAWGLSWASAGQLASAKMISGIEWANNQWKKRSREEDWDGLAKRSGNQIQAPGRPLGRTPKAQEGEAGPRTPGEATSRQTSSRAGWQGNLSCLS